MIGFLFAAAVSADLLGVVDGWREYVSPYGCYLAADYNNGTRLVFNYIVRPPNGAPGNPTIVGVSLANDGWTSLTEGGTYPLAVEFGRKKLAVTATAAGGALQFDVDRRLVDGVLFDKTYIVVSYSNQKLLETGVSGVEAVYQVNMCIRRFNDPFSHQ